MWLPCLLVVMATMPVQGFHAKHERKLPEASLTVFCDADGPIASCQFAVHDVRDDVFYDVIDHTSLNQSWTKLQPAASFLVRGYNTSLLDGRCSMDLKVVVDGSLFLLGCRVRSERAHWVYQYSTLFVTKYADNLMSDLNIIPDRPVLARAGSTEQLSCSNNFQRECYIDLKLKDGVSINSPDSCSPSVVVSEDNAGMQWCLEKSDDGGVLNIRGNSVAPYKDPAHRPRLWGNKTLYHPGDTLEVTCSIDAARPRAEIIWMMNGKRVEVGVEEVVNSRWRWSWEAEASTQTLRRTVRAEDDGVVVTCTHDSAWVTRLSSSLVLRVKKKVTTIVTLKLGGGIDPDDIRLGYDVYFECDVKANTDDYKLAWLHNGREIQQNITAGVILGGQSLVLQRVTRHLAGDYTCRAANTEGNVISNPVELRIADIASGGETRNHTSESVTAAQDVSAGHCFQRLDRQIRLAAKLQKRLQEFEIAQHEFVKHLQGLLDEIQGTNAEQEL